MQIISGIGIANKPALRGASIRLILLYHRGIARHRVQHVQRLTGIHIGNHVAAIGLLGEAKTLRTGLVIAVQLGLYTILCSATGNLQTRRILQIRIDVIRAIRDLDLGHRCNIMRRLIRLIPKRIQIHRSLDACHAPLGRVLPTAIIRGVGEVSAGTVAGHPSRLVADVGRVERGIQIVGVRVHGQVVVAGGLQLGVPGVHDAVVHARAGRRRVPGPRPLLQIVEHRIAQIARLHAGLPQQAHHIIALIGGGRAVIRVRIRVDAERNAQSFAFADVAQGLLVEPVAPAVADADDGALHTIVLGLLPVDLPLPFGHVDHALGLLREQRAIGLEERGRAIVRAPVGAIRVVLQGCGPHHDTRRTVVRDVPLRLRNVAVVFRIGRVIGLRFGRGVPHRLLDLGHLNRNERLAIGFGERISRLVHRTDKLRIGHGIPGLQIHHLAGVGHSQFLRDHRRVVGNLLAYGLRQVLGRIIRHRLRLIR